MFFLISRQVEGIVDLAFREETPEFAGWTVVDFKTDREIERSRDQYAAQVATYVEAVSLASDSPARAFYSSCSVDRP
jgi:ATP-dependent helicase/nuclease subunit A